MPSRAKPKFKRNSAGVKDFLMHDIGVITLMSELGHATASEAEGSGHTLNNGDPLPVEVDTGLSTWAGHADRYVARVTIASPAGVPIEAKYGVLHNAATAAGLEWGRKSHGLKMSYKTKAGKTRKATAAQIAHWTRGKSK